MLTRTAVARAATLVVVLGACSSESRPPELGDCKALDDASCATPVSGGGQLGSDNDAASTVCSAGSSASQCDVCANANCCGSLTACAALADCNNLLSCVMGCAGASACVDACDQSYSNSVTALDAIDSCLTQKCAVCTESGVGDPCTPGASTCIAGLTCSSLWCTKPCAHGSDCAGIGPDSGNFTGEPNACMATSGGVLCTPGCATNADCGDFPGTFCVSTTSFDGLTVSVCSALPDGG
jgi:hypothetical protein